MSNVRPDQLSGVSGLADSDILIAEINPSDGTRKVVQITKGNLLSGISGSSSSGITGLSNIGAGSGIASGVIESDGYLKSLIGGTNLQILGDENSLTLNVTGISGSSSSGITGATNLGAGSGLVSGISNDDLQVKSLVGGTNLQITGDSESLYLNVTGISGGDGSGIGSATNVGVGSGLISGVSDDDIKVKSLFGGTNLQITGDDQTLFLNVTGISGGDGSGVGGASNIGAGSGLISGVLDNDIKVKSLIGGTNVTLSASDNAITINSAGGGGGAGGETSAFAFFSNALNNDGIIEKTFFPTVTPNIYLSGIDVDNASDLTLYLRWDGPHDGYMGTGFINGQAIPTGNIIQLGTSTRRFEGYISGLNLAGTNIVTGVANEFTGTISLQEAGAGPTPFSVFMPPVSSGTPKAGTNLGSTDYKGGDTTTGYVTFDTSDVTGIKVFDHGVSDFIDFTSYTLVDTGDGRHTAQIPITINNARNGSQTLKVIAQNNFGTDGTATESNAVTLDQTYPVVSASDPALSDYVNNQGLNSGESITFVNTISSWDSANGDTVLYSGLSDQISITDSGVFQNPKTVSYVTGVFNNSDNITITAARDDNGAVHSTDAKIRIAKNPIITGIVLSPLAISATSPNITGASEIKGGDVVQAEVVVNTNEVSAGNIQFSVSNAGVSNGSQTSYAPASSSTTLPDGSVSYTLDVNVTSLVGRDGAQSVTVTPRNNFSTTGPALTSAASATVNNTDIPDPVAGPTVTYPVGQRALRDTQLASVQSDETVGLIDTAVLYSSPNAELDISEPTVLDTPTKQCQRIDPGENYNISTDNFKLEITNLPNGMVRSASTVVNTANAAAAFTINNLASSIAVNSGSAVNDNFDLDTDQVLYENPALYLDYTQVPQSTLTATAQGTGTTANDYRITVLSTDGKGEFTFSGSGLNLAGRETFTIGTNPNYKISGMVEGQSYISDQSICAGLMYLGGSVINPSTISMENISEGGSGPNLGTIYTYQAYTNGQQLGTWCTGDHDNKFTIVTSGALSPFLTASDTGDHLFNLDQTNRQANTSAPGALIVISQP